MCLQRGFCINFPSPHFSTSSIYPSNKNQTSRVCCKSAKSIRISCLSSLALHFKKSWWQIKRSRFNLAKVISRKYSTSRGLRKIFRLLKHPKAQCFGRSAFSLWCCFIHITCASPSDVWSCRRAPCLLPGPGIPSSAAVSDVGSQRSVKFSQTLHQLLKLGSFFGVEGPTTGHHRKPARQTHGLRGFFQSK